MLSVCDGVHIPALPSSAAPAGAVSALPMDLCGHRCSRPRASAAGIIASLRFSSASPLPPWAALLTRCTVPTVSTQLRQTNACSPSRKKTGRDTLAAPLHTCGTAPIRCCPLSRAGKHAVCICGGLDGSVLQCCRDGPVAIVQVTAMMTSHGPSKLVCGPTEPDEPQPVAP